ncbi:uncharacterized protein SAPINGB_P005510 [Magnusiomyces paraingens]|uniref:Autophagy-related protein n=1 Tax=Magnusiomyces paraingens TaxID=2606893 RepID=A0A5E8C0Y3_9ASCO|nr:uncharacterized protein SAPINGB_P005510 [Saprochaete ingens]VVT57052.1 unnamed protein product [Saprochaete ingens]
MTDPPHSTSPLSDATTLDGPVTNDSPQPLSADTDTNSLQTGSESSSRYVVEDQGPTTRRELWGWFAYAWASEPFIVSAVGTYVPILLEQFARDNAVRADDHNVPCGMPLPNGDPNSPPPPTPGHGGLPPPGNIGDPSRAQQCVVPIFGHSYYIDTASFALYTFSFSVLIQTLVVISMSGAADRGKFRKKLLVWFAIVGGISTCGFLAVTQSHYLLASILAIISNSCFGAVSVCGNSFLPVLVRNHPEVLATAEDIKSQDHNNNSYDDQLTSEDNLLLEADPPKHVFDHPLLITTVSKLSGAISGKGIALGYISALIVQLVTILLIKALGSSTWSLQVAVFVVGLWWLIFQIPVATLLRSRPGPPLPRPKHVRAHTTLRHKIHRALSRVTRGADTYIAYGWRTLYVTFREARQMRDVATFLLAWFMISDAATTINSAAVLFAKTELQMSAPSLAVIGVMVVFFGILGATLTPRYLAPRLGANPVRSIMFVVFLAAMIPVYGIAGFFTKHLGLRSPWEMYLLAAWYGFALGSINTLCRSVFSLLIPKGKETTFFSLFSVTDKGSSVFGPFVTGLITDKTHNIRYTFYFLLLLIILPIGVLAFVDVERGSREALYLEQVEPEEDDVE